ncbi:hypothetical protein [Acetoanaerobium noterae]|uniref:hypothetical protein n=1 Tax=Acetoanaerobium noterae TaxID=745369 RepID=UPI0028A6CDF4|nr:hypothetical protein [Acetoanaerobium noterae]
MEGWIKVHRSIQEHWLYQEKRVFSKYEAWLDMIMLTNHKDNKFLLGKELIEVERGSFVTSELKLMDRWNWSKTKVRNFLNLLEEDKMILKKSDKKKTTITIVNYNDYQDKETTPRPHEDHTKTIRRPQENTNKNEKNDKNDKNDKKERIIESNNHVSKMDTRCTQNVSIDNHHSMIKYDADHQYYKIAIFIRQKILLINDKAKVPKNDPSSMSKWSDDVRKIVELDKRTLAEFQELTEFAFKNDFWSTVIQSPAGFRKNWDKMFAQMKRPVSSKGNVISFKQQMDVLQQWAEGE